MQRPTTRLQNKRMGDYENFVECLKAAMRDTSVIEAFKEAMKEAIMVPMKSEIEELKELVAKKNENIKDLEERVKELEQKTDATEQYSRRNNLRLHGIPEQKDENLGEVVVKMLNKELQLAPPLTDSDIDRLHRIGPRKSEEPRQCIVKFTNYRTRERIF